MKKELDYYGVLGVRENATQDDIKQAYRKLAKTYHPDSRGGDKSAEERFKEISEAYGILGDKNKRRQYDVLRRNGFSNTAGFKFNGSHKDFGNGFLDDLQDVFSNLFGSAGAQQNPGGSSREVQELFANADSASRGNTRGINMESAITIPFELAANGGETVIKTGADKRIKIKIPAGIENGKKIRIRGHGKPSLADGESGDLYLVIKIASHPNFKRRGYDIYSNVCLNVAEAVLGTEIQVKTIRDQDVKLKIPAGTNSGKVFRLADMGIQGDSGGGDHYVRIEIMVPERLSLSERREFRSWARRLGLL